MKSSFLIRLWMLGGVLPLLLGYPFFGHGQNIPKEESKKKDSPPSTDQKPFSEEQSKGMGSTEIQRPDGGKDKIYYSITTPEEEIKARQEEKEKEDKSWNMLNNIILDQRSKGRNR